MAAINEAWHVLSDPARRAHYDATLAASTAPPPPPRPTPSPASPPPSATYDDEELHEPPASARALRRWALGSGFLVALALGFGVLLLWLAFTEG